MNILSHIWCCCNWFVYISGFSDNNVLKLMSACSSLSPLVGCRKTKHSLRETRRFSTATNPITYIDKQFLSNYAEAAEPFTSPTLYFLQAACAIRLEVINSTGITVFFNLPVKVVDKTPLYLEQPQIWPNQSGLLCTTWTPAIYFPFSRQQKYHQIYEAPKRFILRTFRLLELNLGINGRQSVIV